MIIMGSQALNTHYKGKHVRVFTRNRECYEGYFVHSKHDAAITLCCFQHQMFMYHIDVNDVICIVPISVKQPNQPVGMVQLVSAS